jgi:hypothetical protein
LRKRDAKNLFADQEPRVFQDAAFGQVIGESDPLPHIKKVLGRSSVEAGKKF